MASDREIEARFKFKTDKQGAKAAKEGLDESAKAAARLKEKAEEATKQLEWLKNTGDKLKNIGQTMIMGGAAILGPLGLAAKAYLDQAKGATEESKRWKDAMDKISGATAKIGGVVVKEVLPYLEKGADLLGKAADWAEQNPDAVKAALLIGGSLTVVGTLATTVGTLLQTYSTVITLLGAGGGVGGLAGPLTTLASSGGPLATLAASSGPLFLLIAAVGGLVALINSKFGQQGTTAGGQVLTTAAGGIAGLFGGDAAALDAFAEAGKALHTLTDEQYKNIKATAAATREQEKAAQASQTSERASRNATIAAVNEARAKEQAANSTLTLWQRILQMFNIRSGTSTTPGRAGGGYAYPGLYRLGEGGRREFVLSAASTRAMESVAGGALTQRTFQNLTAGITINGDMSPAMRSSLRREMRSIVQTELASAFDA